MEANDFVAKLKTSGTENESINLDLHHGEFKEISSKLSLKDKGSFALNVLCTLCRNLDKVPNWRSNINDKDLVALSVDCVRDTRQLGPKDRVKVLGCIYHIHRHAVRQNSPMPPELLLKLSYMPFEYDANNLLSDYVKTYWNILADRIMYIEKLKANKLAIIKLLPKLTEDIQKIINIYDTLEFCNNILVVVIKKLYFLYNDFYAKMLNATYKTLFQALGSKSDSKNFKKLTEKDALRLYVKFSEIFHVIIENGTKIQFKDSILQDVVRNVMSLLQHVVHGAGIFHCLQTFYLNSFCSVLTENINHDLTLIFSCVLMAVETSEKVGYADVMSLTYPYIYQMLRQFIEYAVINFDKHTWTDKFNVAAQEKCLELILLLLKKLRNTEQLHKCENCHVRTGLHDSLRLSFTAKHFISTSINNDLNVAELLPLYFAVIQAQNQIIGDLERLGCHNHEKCSKKAQIDIHNTAIVLNRASYYDYSIKIFDMYLKNEIQHFKTDTVRKNISRAFYNKSICELDCKLYEDGLQSAYLAFLFAQPEALGSEKHISLVIDIKAKILKSKSQENESDNVTNTTQLLTALDFCKTSAVHDVYGDLEPFFRDLQFEQLLRHEFAMYVKLWPSILCLAGVWWALKNLADDQQDSAKKCEINRILIEVIVETPIVARTLHCDHFKRIIREVLDEFSPQTLTDKFLYSVLLLLNSEYDISEASDKHGWRGSGTDNVDADQTCITRTFKQEHAAIANAVKAVEILTKIMPQVVKLTSAAYLRHSLAICQTFVPLLLIYSRPAHALQLAHLCCELAEALGDRECYVRNAGTLLYHATSQSTQLSKLATTAGQYVGDLMKDSHSRETALAFICDAAIFCVHCGLRSAAVHYVQYAQANILQALDNDPNINLDLSIGRLLEAQALVCEDRSGPSVLFVTFNLLRHYLTVSSAPHSSYSSRRVRSLTVKLHLTYCDVSCVQLCRRLGLWRRARGVAAAGRGAGGAGQGAGGGAGGRGRGAGGEAAVLAAATCTHVADDAQIKIDNQLKYTLGLPTDESVAYSQRHQPTDKHADTQTPRREMLETMRDAHTFHRLQTSPSLPCVTVPAFYMPDFCTHPENCRCYACETPVCSILACQTAGLEASMYFRAREFNIAKNYFHGALEMFGHVETRTRHARSACRGLGFQGYVLDIVDATLKADFQRVQIEILMEAALFEMASGKFDAADDFVVRIHEISSEMVKRDLYLQNEVLNVMCASARLRKATKTQTVTGLEREMESLKLSPVSGASGPKTPESKTTAPGPPRPRLVSGDEVPNTKRRVIKLNLDEAADEPATVQTSTERAEFKIPVPVTARPVPENITPRPMKSKPKLLITQPSLDIKEIETPNTKNATAEEFFTPRQLDSPTPEEFFTPLTSVKTYAKKSLRHEAVSKNLEREFLMSKPEVDKKAPPKSLLAMPKAGPSKTVETGSLARLKERRTKLKRSTSPGKLVNRDETKSKAGNPDGSQGRTRRQLRKPTVYSLDGDEKMPR